MSAVLPTPQSPTRIIFATLEAKIDLALLADSWAEGENLRTDVTLVIGPMRFKQKMSKPGLVVGSEMPHVRGREARDYPRVWEIPPRAVLFDLLRHRRCYDSGG